MRTMNQQLAYYFRCAQRTLHWVFELIGVSLGVVDMSVAAIGCAERSEAHPAHKFIMQQIVSAFLPF